MVTCCFKKLEFRSKERFQYSKLNLRRKPSNTKTFLKNCIKPLLQQESKINVGRSNADLLVILIIKQF